MSSFLKVPRKIHHALLLLTELAERGGEPATVEEIALRGLISPKFLEQVAAPLRSAGLIRGQRGPGGGYVLTRKPSKITVAAVVKAIEGPMAVAECLGSGSCALAGSCTNRGLWLKLQKRLSSTLESVTLADLITRPHGKKARKN
jgi:Rrf2 family protein